MATITLSNADRNQPEGQHVGDNIAICRISLSVSVSAGDIHRIGKIPHGAIPLDAVFIPGAAFTNTSLGHTVKFGTSASMDLFFASATISLTTQTVQRVTRPLGTRQQISLSDDAMPRFDYITMVNTAALMSVGHIGDLVVWYKMPGQTL